MIWVAMNLLPTALGAILICGVLAAGLSSASTFLSLIGFSLSHDIFESTHGGGDQPASRKPNLRAARFAMLMVGGSVIALALLLPRNIYWLTHFAGPLFASSWGVVAFMSIWSQSLTEPGAFWGMVAGFVVNVGMNAFSLAGVVKWPVLADPILIGVISSYVVTRWLSNRGQMTQHEDEYRALLHHMPVTERETEAVRQTLVWAKVMVVMGMVIAASLAFFYALPYQGAVRTLAIQGAGALN